MRRELILVALCAGFTSVGCATMSTIGTAETLNHKQLQVFAAPEVSLSGPRGNSPKVPLPEMSVGARYGVTDRVEVGLKASALPFGQTLTTASIEGGGKLQLPKPHPRIDVAVAASAGYRFARVSGADYEIISASLPLYVGYDLGERFQVVLGPRIGDQLWLSAGAHPVHLPFAGSSLGLVWRVNDRLTIVPEVTVLRTPTAMDQTDGTVLVHTGLGVLFSTE